MKDPLPCELCKQAPETGEGRLATCETETCAFFDVVVHLETWNALQAALIELQRKAYFQGFGEGEDAGHNGGYSKEELWISYAADRIKK